MLLSRALGKEALLRLSVAAMIVLLILVSARAEASASSSSTVTKSMDSFYCDVINVPVDAHGYPVVQSAILNGASLTVRVSYGSAEKQRNGKVFPLLREWPLGFVLDNQPMIGLHPLIEEPTLKLSLFLRGLSPGKHRLDIGFLNPGGKLQEDNSYCFSVPGNERWSY